MEQALQRQATHHHPPFGRVEPAPAGGMLGKGEPPFSKTRFSECSHGECFFYRDANPGSPSPVNGVSKQQLLTLPEGGCGALVSEVQP